MSKKNKDKKDRARIINSLSMITQFGINMLVPILLCTFIGIFIDKKAGTGYFVIILFFVGALAGFRNVYRLAMKMNGDKKDSEDKGN